MTESAPMLHAPLGSLPEAERPDPPRVLHVVDNLRLGGAQHLVLKMVRALEERGIRSRVCVLDRAERTYAWEWLPDEVIHLSAPCDYRRPWELWRCAELVGRAIDQVRPDLVHSHLWLSDVATALANRRRGLPHVSHIVDRREWQRSRRWRHRLRRRLTRWAFDGSPMRFLAVSEAARQYAIDTLGLEPGSIGVAYNSVDPAQFEDAPEPAFLRGARINLLLGMASRLEPEKGHVYLFEALAELNRRGRRLELIVTGEGPYKQQLVECCRRLEIASQVRFVGWVESVRGLLEEIDVFVVPSIHSEGLPTTILEAMAAGRVVVATDVGGAAEAVRDQLEGVIVPPRDPQRLADALVDLQEQPETMRRLATSARGRVRECFSLDRMTEVVVGHYESRLSRAGGTSVG